jgi:chromatin segregation and condensation protein Rec8/ScpA/Scc1 (kleisin family)
MTAFREFSMFSELSKRVEDWERTVAPRVQYEVGRRDFDMDEYGAVVREGVGRALEAAGKESDTAPFAAVVSGAEAESDDVPRMFLAMLELANRGAIDIVREGEGGSHGIADAQRPIEFGLRLLGGAPTVDIDGFRAPSLLEEQ